MRKVPPPKPKRSPNTKLSGSYEEINAAAGSLQSLRPSIAATAELKLALLSSRVPGLGGGGGLLMQRAASVDAPGGLGGGPLSLYPRDEEDIYIEMVGAHQQTQQRARSLQEPPDSPELEEAEAVYEEMTYLPSDDMATAATVLSKAARLEALQALSLVGFGVAPSPLGEAKRAGMGVDAASHHSQSAQQGNDGGCEIPAPFPNLLPHRPPLLVFPPSPVTCSPASDESPLTPLEVKKLPVFETNLNYAAAAAAGAGPAGGAGPGESPISPQQQQQHHYSRQRADSSPSLTGMLVSATPPSPLTPPPPALTTTPSAPPPPYRPPSHFPFPPDSGFLSLTRTSSVAAATGSDSPKPTSLHRSAAVGAGADGADPLGKPPPYSPGKGGGRAEPRRAHSCSSSPLLFNPANGRPLTSPLDELNTLFSSGRHLLRKSGRKVAREGGFNSNINLPARDDCGSAPTSPSPQLQDKNANNHTPNSSGSAPIENGNQITNAKDASAGLILR
ncbi:hypothetical protein CRUP_036626 [Coryphaenoides rupestris]|nr:hypothetical protein CRUP_036626 [Coryphaenoides rupestris]